MAQTGISPGPSSREHSAPGLERAARTRGLNPLGALAYVRHVGGAEAIAQVLGRLREDDLVLLGAAGDITGRRLTATSWVPFKLQVRLLRAIDQSLGEGDLSTLFEVGRFMGSRDVPRVFRPFLRLGNPGWIMSLSTRLWRYYHDRGRWELSRSPVSVLATLFDHPESDEAFCATFMGWLTGALEVSGGVDVRVDHPVCHARGGSKCVFTARWAVSPEATSPGRKRAPDE